MADEKLDRIRLAFMQDILPVGLAILDRARKGGIGSVLKVINESTDPLGDLRKEGDSAAQDFREKLDNVSPGLGNPVMEVKVSVKTEKDTDNTVLLDDSSLVPILLRIEDRLDQLRLFLKDNQIEKLE